MNAAVRMMRVAMMVCIARVIMPNPENGTCSAVPARCWTCSFPVAVIEYTGNLALDFG